MHTTLQKLTDVATCYSALHRYAVIHLQALLVAMFHVCIGASLHNPLNLFPPRWPQNNDLCFVLM